MPRGVEIKPSHTPSELRRLAVATKDANQSRRLLSIAAVLDGMSRAEAAKIGGMDRQTLRDWVHRFQPADQRYESAYLFGAICPARGVGAALALPFADTDAMQRHLDEIALHVARDAHAVLLLDRAGWHTTGNLVWPKNITPILLPSRSPELNPVEQIWQYLRANFLSNRVFDDYDDIIDAASEAWRKLLALPSTITSIGMRDWAHEGQL